ncbi:twin-arginine translocation pathway signal protein [Pseudomonas sp. S25]|uniref:Twin-arginine translocation pathway signal protein n=1 Tax=Pseudomonas maioricensis TaxID=1766623 RepID=A0ABS9ZDJ6_9PSED|nr:twin-arginine translocation pathway signal protein [Pseudomonas sp. S25]MCI8208528.1 twin-arginine translocation pathway signal protein [Pseudomonas sp. S25]
MNTQPNLSRRNFLQVSLGASAFLSTVGLTASLSGCSATAPANGFMVLRTSDLPFLRALIPVLINGSVQPVLLPQATDDTLHCIDKGLNHLSPAMLQLTQQLLDVLTLPFTRGPLTGVWSAWEKASNMQIQQFLDRWQNSSLDLLRQGHAALLQLTLMAWYSHPESWAHCGYAGPPRI